MDYTDAKKLIVEFAENQRLYGKQAAGNNLITTRTAERLLIIKLLQSMCIPGLVGRVSFEAAADEIVREL